jgi:hypothetical protein
LHPSFVRFVTAGLLRTVSQTSARSRTAIRATPSPFDPQLITEAETIKEAFENARDALAASRRKLIKKLAGVRA